ncbi:hypothetical protein E6O75_ATG00856 [Venturia nashicola]|uniref:MYND-type domain-containing protein n=1 Tax=Venturia nashicola TaxID=86259 RepID=A0A4Z1PCT3_9PEZI|nr:hypothetical protein E6O75_ATG00856 [Venturia nashicola]
MRDFHLTPFPNEGFCSRCSKLCKKVCHKCEDAPTYDGKRQITYYCSVKCQLLDWPAHHGTCRARQTRAKLLRVAGVLQAIWYVVRRETFDWELAGMNSWRAVTEEDGKVKHLEVPQLELVARDRDVMEEEDGRREQIVYQRFPDGDGEEWVKEEMNAALAFGSCQFAVRMLHGPLRTMIDGLHNKTEEICFQPQRCKVNVTRVWITDKVPSQELEEAEATEETKTFEQPGPSRVVNQDELDNLDQIEVLDASDDASQRASNSGIDDTVVHNEVHPEDQNWAAYVHGGDDELGHDETDDSDSTIRARQFEAQGRRNPQADFNHSDEQLSETIDLNRDAMEVAESLPDSHEDVLGGWIIPDGELVHFAQDQGKQHQQPVDDDSSEWLGGPSEEDIQMDVEIHEDPGSQHYGQSGYSGHWLGRSKSLRRVPKKENLDDVNISPTDNAHEQSESNEPSVHDEAYFESEVQLGETHLHDLEASNDAGDWGMFDGNSQGHEHQVLKEALDQASLDEEQQQEHPLVAKIKSEAALEAYHCAVKIEMSNGELWVFDPTAAQYGYEHILVPLSEYLVLMKSPPSSVCSHPFGTAKSNIEENVAWNQLRRLGREVTDAGDYGEQDVRRRFQWGSMDGIIEDAISNALGLQKELEKVKGKEQKEKEKKESVANLPKKRPAFNSGPSTTNRFSTAIKVPILKRRTSLLLPKKSNTAQDGPEIGHKRLLRAPNIEHEILVSATLTHLTSLLIIGRESLYIHPACASRDNRVKFWSIFRAFHERFPTPDTEPVRPYEELKKQCKKAIKEVARKEKEGRKRMKKQIKDMRRESRRVVKEHERRQKELLKRVERLMHGWEAEDNDERWHNPSSQPFAPTNNLDMNSGMNSNDPALFEAADVGAFEGEGEEDQYGYDAFLDGNLLAETEEMVVAMGILGQQSSGLTEGELNALEDFAEHLEWAERNGLAGRMDILTASQSRVVMPAV